MATHVLTLVLALAVGGDTPVPTGKLVIKKDEVEYQTQMFESWWGTKLEWKLSELPTEGMVPEYRIPYSGHDYPDRAGGTDTRARGELSALGKYDMAFHGGRGLAVAFERIDVTRRPDPSSVETRRARRSAPVTANRIARLENPSRPPGLFERARARRSVGWYGHCNGWTAASIRHAEPTKSVVRNGVVFTPADIKGLLAELYMHCETEFLGGVDTEINPGTLHVTLTNWLGRGDHPVGMEAVPGKVVYNYPIYNYKAEMIEHSSRLVEVKMKALYAVNTGHELVKSPRLHKEKYFHYALDLNKEGKIVGGRYYGDSARIDMLWSPLKPTQGGKDGNESGNPHLDAKTVLSMWRESAPTGLRKKWMNIDPTDEDKIVVNESD
jgi:hypothetical protein